MGQLTDRLALGSGTIGEAEEAIETLNWDTLLADFEAKRADAKAVIAAPSDEDETDAIKTFWAGSAESFAAVIFSLRANAPIPDDVIHFLRLMAFTAIELSEGRIGPLINGVKRHRGGQSTTALKLSDMLCAVAYRDAVKQRWIEDPYPTETLSWAYGVSARTIQMWCKTHRLKLVWAGRDTSPERIEEKMKQAAKRYRQEPLLGC